VLNGGGDGSADPGETVSMRLTIGDLSPTSLTAGHGTLATTSSGVTVTGNASDFPTVAPGQSGEGTSAFVFTIPSNAVCGSAINFVLDVTSQGLLSRVPFSVRVGRAVPSDFFGDDVESGRHVVDNR
jgi:hypothetical protein